VIVRSRAELADRERLQRRTVRVLVAGQALGGAAIGVGGAVSPLLAKQILHGDATFAGLAFAAVTFGSALAAVPISRVMARRGRRSGLVRGYVAATMGAGAAVVAAEVESFPLLLAGMLLFGWGTAANLLARYAGADLAAPEHKARAIATVVWATTIGAVAGPNVLGPAGGLADWLGLPRLSGPYVVGLVCFGGAAAIVGILLRPDPLVMVGGLETKGARAARRSTLAQLGVVFRHRAAATGLIAMLTAHAVMVSVMTMTPLHLRDHGDSLEIVGVVISLHIAGMFAFSPIVGALSDRWGHLQTAYAAAAMLASSTLLAAAPGHNHAVIGLALTMLGLGWSMATISGSALVTAALPTEERARSQGVVDMTTGLAGATGGTMSGIVVGTIGYTALSLSGAVLAGAALAVLVWHRRLDTSGAAEVGAAVPPHT
jgi:MFS family permease